MLINILFPLGLLASNALACPPANPSNNTGIVFGSDEPADPATVGYMMNHLSLNVNNLTRSMEFYTSAFGFRHIMTYHLTPHVSFTYMSHQQGGKNGSAYQTTMEMLRFKNNAAGHLEMVHLDVPKEDIPGSPQRVSTVNHIGIIVPDLEATQARLEQLGVTIYKGVNEPMPTTGFMSSKFDFGDATNISDEEFVAVQAAMTQLNALTIFASDPDGNLLEILPLDDIDFTGAA